MTFYYTEPKAGNLRVFALDGGGPARVAPGTNLTTLEGGLPRVGEPGHTLGGRVLPGYGFTPTEGGEPISGASPPQPTGAQSQAQSSPFPGRRGRDRTGRADLSGPLRRVPQIRRRQRFEPVQNDDEFVALPRSCRRGHRGHRGHDDAGVRLSVDDRSDLGGPCLRPVARSPRLSGTHTPV